MTYIFKGKELNQGQVELYRHYNEEGEFGNKTWYSLQIGGKVGLTLRPDNIYYNIDGTGTIAVHLGDEYPKKYWSVENKQNVIIEDEERAIVLDNLGRLLIDNGFEEVKRKTSF